MAHAVTVFISYRLMNAKGEEGTHLTREHLEEAWTVQTNKTIAHGDDIDKECLALLEERMFEWSLEAGVAGEQQWGLDAGDHQHWNPYAGLPPEWNHGITTQLTEDKRELLVRPATFFPRVEKH